MLHATSIVFFLGAAVGQSVHELGRETWLQKLPGQPWLVYFAIQDCKHCQRLAPMMDALASGLPAARVGRIDGGVHNGSMQTETQT